MESVNPPGVEDCPSIIHESYQEVVASGVVGIVVVVVGGIVVVVLSLRSLCLRRRRRRAILILLIRSGLTREFVDEIPLLTTTRLLPWILLL